MAATSRAEECFVNRWHRVFDRLRRLDYETFCNEDFPMRLALTSLTITSLLLTACGQTTKLTTTWGNPAGGAAQVHHVVAVFASKDPLVRHTIEDRIVRQIPNSVQSYTFIENAESVDRDALRRLMKDKGFDGVLVMRVADIDRQLTYVPGANTWPGDFYGYWGNAWTYPYDPTYFYGDGVYGDYVIIIETALYSVNTDKLLWAGRSRTSDPRSIRKVADQVSTRAVDDMRKQRLLP
jgi:hypothetical protein